MTDESSSISFSTTANKSENELSTSKKNEAAENHQEPSYEYYSDKSLSTEQEPVRVDLDAVKNAAKFQSYVNRFQGPVVVGALAVGIATALSFAGLATIGLSASLLVGAAVSVLAFAAQEYKVQKDMEKPTSEDGEPQVKPCCAGKNENSASLEKNPAALTTSFENSRSNSPSLSKDQEPVSERRNSHSPA